MWPPPRQQWLRPRLVKEMNMYKKEVDAQQARIDKLKAEGADAADIKKQAEVLEESANMIPDTHKRLEAAQHELQELVVRVCAVQ